MIVIIQCDSEGDVNKVRFLHAQIKFRSTKFDRLKHLFNYNFSFDDQFIVSRTRYTIFSKCYVHKTNKKLIKTHTVRNKMNASEHLSWADVLATAERYY